MRIFSLIKTFILACVLIAYSGSNVYAGGAVKKRKEMKERVMRAQMEARKKAQIQAQVKARAVAQAAAQAAAQQVASGQVQLQRLEVEHIRVNPKINIKKQSLPKNITYETTITEINGEQLSQILSENSLVWLQIIDQPIKEMIVKRYIDWFANRGVSIQKSPESYASLIDEMAQVNITLLQQPFQNVLKIVSIMEYDFDNGQDKDALARQLFDNDRYYENKKRIGLIP